MPFMPMEVSQSVQGVALGTGLGAALNIPAGEIKMISRAINSADKINCIGFLHMVPPRCPILTILISPFIQACKLFYE
ncbi:MAG TPA: hypothetical protein VK914_03960 [bacterium]|nr:hypothetical protein [bacterium]